MERKPTVQFELTVAEKWEFERVANELGLSGAELGRRAVRVGLPILQQVRYPGVQPKKSGAKEAA